MGTEAIFHQLAVQTGVFEIDAEGRVWRVRNITRPCTPRRAERKTPGKRRGYLNIDFTHNKRRYIVKAHRLVWHHFHGEIPQGMQINHKNGNKSDNCLENLELVTHSENVRHSLSTLGRGNTRLTDEAVAEIRRTYLDGGVTMQEIGARLGVSKAAVSKIINRTSWGWVP